MSCPPLPPKLTELLRLCPEARYTYTTCSSNAFFKTLEVQRFTVYQFFAESATSLGKNLFESLQISRPPWLRLAGCMPHQCAHVATPLYIQQGVDTCHVPVWFRAAWTTTTLLYNKKTNVYYKKSYINQSIKRPDVLHVFQQSFSALEVFSNGIRYINRRFTYLLTYSYSVLLSLNTWPVRGPA